MKLKILVIGKNSRLAARFMELCVGDDSVETTIAYSHTEIDEACGSGLSTDVVLVLFSLSPNVMENARLINRLADTSLPTLVIGSAAAISKRRSKFRYSRLKYSQMKNCTQARGNVLYGVFGTFESLRRYGSYYKSDLSEILQAVKDVSRGHIGVREYFRRVDTEIHKPANRYYGFAEVVLGTRATALFYKLLSNTHYGYNRAE